MSKFVKVHDFIIKYDKFFIIEHSKIMHGTQISAISKVYLKIEDDFVRIATISNCGITITFKGWNLITQVFSGKSVGVYLVKKSDATNVFIQNRSINDHLNTIGEIKIGDKTLYVYNHTKNIFIAVTICLKNKMPKILCKYILYLV